MRLGILRQQQWQTIWLIIVSLVLLLVLILQAAILWQLARLPV